MEEVKPKEPKINAYKIVLKTGKVVILREMKIKDQNLATRMLGQKKMNQAELQLALQENLVKILLLQIDDRTLNHAEKEDLDSLFTVKEFGQVLQVINKITSDDEENSQGEAEIETLLI